MNDIYHKLHNISQLYNRRKQIWIETHLPMSGLSSFDILYRWFIIIWLMISITQWLLKLDLLSMFNHGDDRLNTNYLVTIMRMRFGKIMIPRGGRRGRWSLGLWLSNKKQRWSGHTRGPTWRPCIFVLRHWQEKSGSYITSAMLQLQT